MTNIQGIFCCNEIFRWQWCWWHRYVSDFMMVTDFRCWWNHYVGDCFRYVGDFLNVLNRSPTSWIGHQHLKLVTSTFGLQHLSPTSMLQIFRCNESLNASLLGQKWYRIWNNLSENPERTWYTWCTVTYKHVQVSTLFVPSNPSEISISKFGTASLLRKNSM